jgi:hypothetical protein
MMAPYPPGILRDQEARLIDGAGRVIATEACHDGQLDLRLPFHGR